jgi:hypothetical protein
VNELRAELGRYVDRADALPAHAAADAVAGLENRHANAPLGEPQGGC